MAYRKFTFADLKTQFKVSNKEGKIFDTPLQKLSPSDDLQKQLLFNQTLPVRSEKAKSELIIMPILIDLMKQNDSFFRIYSGETLKADETTGLNGECDFILSENTGSYDISIPIFTIVEAKKGELDAAMPQCAAQLVGANLYNTKLNNAIKNVYGCVTSANNWQFLKLENNEIIIDKTIYYLTDLPLLMGAFQQIIDNYKKQKGKNKKITKTGVSSH